MDNTDIMSGVEDTAAKTPCKCKNAIKKLCSMKVKDSLDFKMTVSCKDSDSAEESECFTKTIKSDSEFSLMKTFGAIMIVGGGISLICSLCSLFKKN